MTRLDHLLAEWLGYAVMCGLLSAALVVAFWFVHDRGFRKGWEACERAGLLAADELATAETVPLRVLAQRGGAS